MDDPVKKVYPPNNNMTEPCSQDAATALMRDIVEVCRKHGLWLGHEDDYGAFLVRINSTEEWLMAAYPDRHEVKQ